MPLLRYIAASMTERYSIYRCLRCFARMIKRSILESVGRLDESYGVGMFEDDDLCVRIKNAGFRLVCAEDVFIHHFQQGTFKLLPPEVYKQVYEEQSRKV